ncbi:uncharacterized protein P884DRAFT_228026 [Thermothelomyces heterothallicus CBS 202.75]|uniref:uncharacterized protein n=1 Tax=Thermothelomyces heterothallicus CBS 202.75 TaxID=1149848 RepID=UPI003742153A
MRYTIHFVLLFLLGLATGLALPRRQSEEPFAVLSHARNTACHTILSSCRVDADCCSGLKCGLFDNEALCVPIG